jgi:large subunit ribosomal protein L1
MQHGKNYRSAKAKVDKKVEVPLGAAVATLDAFPRAKFDETVDFAIRLNVNPRHADQMVRGTVVLPNGTGRTQRVLVITRGPKEQEALAAGADMVGADEYLPKIKDGWTDCDVIIATPDMMGELGKLGKILGPRGLMPNPKVGTLTNDIAKAVKEAKAGRIEYRVDKAGIIHAPVGKRSFTTAQLEENIRALYAELIRVRPSAVKGVYVKSVFVSGTMTPAIRIEPGSMS